MNEDQIKKLVNDIKALEPRKRSSKTAFLDQATVKRAIESTIKEGVKVKQIYESIVANGYKLSMQTFSKWLTRNDILKKDKYKKGQIGLS